MNKIGTLLAVIYFFVAAAILYCIGVVICLLTAWFDPNRRILHYYSCAWGFHYVKVNPFWKITFEGVDQIDSHKTYVLVANHQSFLDILLLYGLFKPYKWVTKQEIIDVPMVGWNCILNNYVIIKRGDLKSIKEMMHTCRDWLKRGVSIMMFPEGTRSEDGEIHEFRDGSFRLAAECGVPVVPIVVEGTHEILPKHAKWVKFRANITIRVLPPVNPADFNNKSAAIRDHVHNVMTATLAEMRAHPQPEFAPQPQVNSR